MKQNKKIRSFKLKFKMLNNINLKLKFSNYKMKMKLLKTNWPKDNNNLKNITMSFKR